MSSDASIGTPKVSKSDAEWREQLSPEEYAVLRQAGTERPFTGEYDEVFTEGVYSCRACGAELFRSDTKFDSHCGWPSFYAPLAGLTLPSGTRFAAGFAHESQELDDQLRVRSLIEQGLGHPVDISAACGLGRRTAESGLAVLHRTAELLDE